MTVDVALVIEAVAALGAVVAVVIFWMERGKAEQKAAQACREVENLKREFIALKETVTTHRINTASDIAIIKTLAEANTVALTQAENRLAKAVEDLREGMNTLGERLNQFLAQAFQHQQHHDR